MISYLNSQDLSVVILSILANQINDGIYLMLISTIVQFYCRSQFYYWMKSESEDKTTELQQIKKVYPVKSPRV